MSFLIRVQLPDEPGSLGTLAESFGIVGGNIKSVDIVETSPDGTVTDDIVIEVPPGSMADILVTAVHSVPGAEVDSIRPFTGRVDRRGQIDMLADVAHHHRDPKVALDHLVAVIPRSMTASWALILDTSDPIRRITASDAAPAEDDTTPSSIDVEVARILNPDREAWIPESWAVLDTALAAAPLEGTSLVMAVGRLGGPDFLASEVIHLGKLAQIVGTLLRK